MAPGAGEAIVHLNGVKELENLLGYLHLRPPALVIDKKPSTGLNEGPVFKKSNQSVSGFTTVAKALVNHSEHQELLGNDPLECADVDQWLEYSQSLSHADNLQLKSYCKDLNIYLEDKTYFVADRLTLADIILYSCLHKVFTSLVHSEREELINLSRWCDQVQHIPHVRQKLPLLLFHRTTLYI